METEPKKTPTTPTPTPQPETAPVLYLGDLDRETYELLIEDKIATGG